MAALSVQSARGGTVSRARPSSAAAALEGLARLTIPPLALCTDNAAMIAAAAPHAPRGGDLRADPGLAW